MKKIKVTYLALGAFVCVASCSKEATEPDVIDWGDGKIYFKSTLSDLATSRAMDMTLDGLDSFQVTCFNTADTYKDQAGFLSPYFENATFIRKVNGGTTYVSSPAEEPHDWPANDGLLRFLAFSPTLSDMAAGNSVITDHNRGAYFNLINGTVEAQSTVSVDYRLGTVRINPDISRQFDFVTAEAAGERWKDFAGGVELAFSHRLCQVELRAWGAGSGYDFEIAGVRIGNPVVEGTFVFADDDMPANAGKWAQSDNAVKDKVEYLYRSAGTSTSAELPATGDRIYRINSKEHNSPESAASIMGKGGCAMVIPTVNTAWEGTADPNIGNRPYKTDRMYFSVLLRASQSGTPLYPYAGNPNGMTVIYYAVDREGTIISRLYPGDENGEYFTDPDHTTPYTATDGVEVKDFGWAAVSVDADWSAGRRYVYTLDYSEGIGLHDPADPEPGKPIVGKSSISWGVSVGSWDYATPADN
ncbi:MAG: fimbrillin family protein, partial [Muribaculaceae bacterium]|nr:fimbrillin family protein [Muribaculaceae bacterium]